jgi:hypothetical protein
MERQLKRQIEKAKARIADLEARKEFLNIHGYWDLGYWQGRLRTLEDWLDEITENNSECLE